MSLEEQIIDCAASAYMVSAELISPETVVRAELSPKSMSMLAFVSSIENECDIVIPLSQTSELITIQDFIDKARELGA